ncbi:MAG: hypothetical protein AAGE52_40590, partial [Myxococcota bacterium]
MTRWQQTDAQFLITSRIPLGLEAERLVRVEPLSASRGHPSPASALLLESVRRRGGRLDHSAKAADVVALLEGVPLAILIVAGQIERVGLDAIHDELVRGGSTLSALHQRVARSWELLDEGPREVGRHVATFSLGVSIAELAEMCERPHRECVNAVDALATHSLVALQGERVRATVAVRDFCQALEEAERYQARHASYLARKTR